MANYNHEQPYQRGYWYDFAVIKKTFIPSSDGTSATYRVYGRLLSPPSVCTSEDDGSMSDHSEENCEDVLYCLKFVNEIFQVGGMLSTEG